jgi:hypothetical protein
VALDKKSYESDAIANLYRAALYLARGSKASGLGFYKKAKRILGNEVNVKLISGKNDTYLAEKILDEYRKLK